MSSMTFYKKSRISVAGLDLEMISSTLLFYKGGKSAAQGGVILPFPDGRTELTLTLSIAPGRAGVTEESKFFPSQE